jgi:mono/diheme cytochrome c family protein
LKFYWLSKPEEIDMTKVAVRFAMIAVLIVGFENTGWAEDFDAGTFEYQSSCATCHGVDGKGKGPLSSQLKVAPPDLTVLTKRNNGVFPFSSVYEVIDGRQAILTHGPRDMPVWGNRYRLVLPIEQALRRYSSVDPEYVMRSRLLAIVDYLNRIQEK